MSKVRKDMYLQVLLISLYLVSIVSANLVVTIFGASASILCAFLFIGLDLTIKDKLQDMWQENLMRNMAMLIAGGSIISYLINKDAANIAFASFMAFGLSTLLDAFVYQSLLYKSWFKRANGSNLAGAMVDSIVFPLLAFGWPLMIGVMLGQFVAKVVGGFIWSAVLQNAREGERLWLKE